MKFNDCYLMARELRPDTNFDQGHINKKQIKKKKGCDPCGDTHYLDEIYTSGKLHDYISYGSRVIAQTQILANAKITQKQIKSYCSCVKHIILMRYMYIYL